MITPERDYLMDTPAYEFPYRGLGDPKETAEKFIDPAAVGRLLRGDEAVLHRRSRAAVLNHGAGSDFSWLRSRVLGGRSILWGRMAFRMSDLDFAANLRDGVGDRLADSLRRHCAVVRVRRALRRVSRARRSGSTTSPTRHFLPPMQLTCAEEQVKAGLTKAYGGRRIMTIGRTAVLTQPIHGRAACHYCNSCERGCSHLLVLQLGARHAAGRDEDRALHHPAATRWCTRWRTTTAPARRPVCGSSMPTRTRRSSSRRR